MNGSVFVDFFRMHWNETAFGEQDWFLNELKQFDDMNTFKIQYVFGDVKSYSEYCDRKSLTTTMDSIIQKFFNLYKVAKNLKLPLTWLDFSFEDVEHSAEISMYINGCLFRVIINASINYDRQK